MNILIQNNKFIKKDKLKISVSNKNFKIRSDQFVNFIKINGSLELLYIGNIFFDKTKNYTNLERLILQEFRKSKSKYASYCRRECCKNQYSSYG